METVVFVSPDDKLASNAIFKNREAFARHGLAVEFIYTRSCEPVVQAMLGGQAGYTHVCGAPVPAAVAGRGLKILAAFQTSSFGLYAHPSIRHLRQLEGQTISLAGSITRPALETALGRHGLPLSAVNIVRPASVAPGRSGNSSDQVERVLDGTYAAVSLNPPHSQAAHRAGLQCLLRIGDVYPIPTLALLVRDDLLHDQRDQVRNVLRGILDSIDDYIRDSALGIGWLRELAIAEDLLAGAYWE